MRFVKTAESIFDIPSNFTRVEYLESDSTAYIDTGVSGANNNLKIEMGFSYSKFTAYGYLFSNYESETANVTRFCLNGTDTNWGLAYINTKSQNGAIYTSNFTKDSFHTFILTKTSVTIDGNTTTNNNPPSGTENTKNIILFNRGAGTYYEKRDVGMRCYYFRIYDNDTPVRDMIPCIDPLGRACMYDLVGKKPYYNQGTGEFSVGRQIIPVEYLESTGDEYIDTGYVPKPTSSYKCDFELTNIATTSGAWFCVFGSVESNNVVFTELFLPRASGGGDVNQVLAGNHNSTFIRENYVWAINTPYDFEMTTTDVSINGASQGSITVDSSVSCSHSIYLFARHESNDTVRYNVKAKVRDFKVLENNTLVRDFIPCKDENNVGFMFDTLSSTVYENAGTGAFVIGQNKYKMKLRLIKDNILPTGYTQVEYLESSGTQYIDTGVAGSSTLKIEMDGQKAGAGYGVYFGAGTGNNRIQAIYVNDYNSARIGDITNAQLGSDSEKFNIVVDTLNKIVIYNGTSYPFAYTSALTNLNIFIFTRNEGGSFVDKAKAKCWSCKIWDNGVLVRNFIPAIDPSGTPCMYDLVSRTPFYNQGTGTFITGKPVLPMVRFIKDIVPAGYKIVNYLQSTGTQYIDTGVKPTQLTEAEYKCAVTGSVANVDSHLFGSRLSASSEAFDLAYMNTTPNGIEKFRFVHGTITTQETTTSVTASQLANPHTYYMSGTSFKVDGSEKMSFTTASFTGSYSLWLFGVNNAGSLHNQVRAQRVYKCKIYDNNTLVRNFIPVIRLLDNKAGMWDTVTKQFYTTPVGDFITG